MEPMVSSMLVFGIVGYEVVDPSKMIDYSIVHSWVMTVQHFQDDYLALENYVQLLLVFVVRPIEQKENEERESGREECILVDRKVVVALS